MRLFLLIFLAAVALPPPASAQEPLTARDSAFHLLNRLGYGPTPGQFNLLLEEGLDHWVERQIAALGEDTARSTAESRFDLLDYSTDDLVNLYAEAREDRKDQASTDSSGPRSPPTETQLTVRNLEQQMGELAVARAVVADHQLEEVMADFWTNHFNVFGRKGLVRVYLPKYIESVIRPNALGKFEDLLVATAQSPAMLFYLDNVQSVAADMGEMSPRHRPESGRANRPTGINENYARELLELHTLGVDGGYTQEDVINVARVLTGWSIERPRSGSGFHFYPRAHDREAKIVLGTEFPAGHGEDEGLRLLHLLATHPATIRHVSSKLCERFVSDGDRGGCDDAAVSAWKKSDGDIREVLRAIVWSSDFWAPANMRAKVKTPLEFVVSAIRATGATIDSAAIAARAIAYLGQPLYQQPAPTGYGETQEEWVNSGALLKRMNFAVALVAGSLQGIHLDPDRIVPTSSNPDSLVEAINRLVLGGTMTPNTRSVILEEITSTATPQEARALALGLTIGSPEFQRQ